MHKTTNCAAGVTVRASDEPTRAVASPAATYTAEIRSRVNQLIESRGLGAVAEAAGVTPAELRIVLDQGLCPDMPALAALESTFNTDLWPGPRGDP